MSVAKAIDWAFIEMTTLLIVHKLCLLQSDQKRKASIAAIENWSLAISRFGKQLAGMSPLSENHIAAQSTSYGGCFLSEKTIELSNITVIGNFMVCTHTHPHMHTHNTTHTQHPHTHNTHTNTHTLVIFKYRNTKKFKVVSRIVIS